MTSLAETRSHPARVLLDGVPRVSFQADPGRDAETVPFLSCLRACLEYLDLDMGYRAFTWRGTTWRQSQTYVHLMGVTGAAFRLSWRPGWHLDNVEIMYLSDEPAAPFDRAFEAVGLDHEFLHTEEGRDNEICWRTRIVDSIAILRRPVLAFGVVGPPECCIITGYDEGGDVLIGWSFFQDFPEFNAGVEFEPSGEFRRRDWFELTQSPLLIGGRRPHTALDEVYRRALAWALQVVQTPATTAYGAVRHNGLAAYHAWAEQLQRGDELADPGELGTCYMAHNDAVSTVAEGRWYAACFLRQVAAHRPGLAGPLLEAASHYEAEHDLMWQLWTLVGGIGYSAGQMEKLAQPEIRRQMVPIIHRARDLDAQAAASIEQALALWDAGSH